MVDNKADVGGNAARLDAWVWTALLQKRSVGHAESLELNQHMSVLCGV